VIHATASSGGCRSGSRALCGIRPDFAKAMENLKFKDRLAADRVFREEDEKCSATFTAVRHVHELLQNNSCPHCERSGIAVADRESQYYLV
jgi:hypothetical protein